MKRTSKTNAVEKIERRAKRKAVRGSSYDGDITKVISTGSLLLDLAISGGRIRGGGIPGGIIVEIFGPNQGGKTVLVSEIAGGVQRQKGEVKFWDAEARLNKKFAQLFDFKIKDCEYGVPEQVADVFRPLLKWEPGGPDCMGDHNPRKKKCRECDHLKKCKRYDPDDTIIHGVFIDSFAQLSGSMEEGDKEDKRGSARAKDFSSWLRKTGPLVTKKNWLLVGTNQIRDKQDAMSFGKKTKTPGGHAIPHACSLRLEIVPIKYLRDEKKIGRKEVKQEYGVRSMVKIVKSSVWRPHNSAEVYIIYDYGIDDIRANLQFLKDHSKNKNYWTEDFSMDDAVATIEEDELEAELKEAVIDRWEDIQEMFKRERKPKRRV